MSDYYHPLTRNAIIPRSYGPLVAYDIETSSIAAEEVLELRYITVHGEALERESRLRGYDDLEAFLCELWPQLAGGTRFVAHNGNRFDLRIVLAALADRPKWKIRCFVNAQTDLRAALVMRGRKSAWFLDSRAMLGMDCRLDELTRAFGGERARKIYNFDDIEFDPELPAHRAYARRDSRTLYEAISRAEKRSGELFGYPLQPTIGALAIRCFTAKIPSKVQIFALPEQLYAPIRNGAMRGGYCYARRYSGPLWTYDQNCAYGAAMRAAELPQGRGAIVGAETDRIAVYRAVIARKPRAPFPYPVRDPVTYKSTPTAGEPRECWLTSTETAALRDLGWTVEVLEGYCWPATFTMKRWIDKLEQLRVAHPPRSVEALLVKQICVNAYGKMLQEQQLWEYLISNAQPKAGVPVCDDEGEIYPGIWMVPEEKDTRRCYMRPQLAAFITAHVRLQLYRIACEHADIFVRADTDSLSFSQPVQLPRGRNFGKWKVESNGERAIIIKNKTYWTHKKAAASGLQLEAVTIEEYERWMKTGRHPHQPQRHLRAWLKNLAPAWYSRA